MVTRLVHLNGPPGIGKSTVSALYAARHPGVLNLDVDALHRLVGGWQDEDNHTWQVVWPLARAMAATHLDGGHDVVLPQYLGRLDEITGFEETTTCRRSRAATRRRWWCPAWPVRWRRPTNS